MRPTPESYLSVRLIATPAPPNAASRTGFGLHRGGGQTGHEGVYGAQPMRPRPALPAPSPKLIARGESAALQLDSHRLTRAVVAHQRPTRGARRRHVALGLQRADFT